MLILIILFIISFFLAVRSNFDSLLMAVLVLGSALLYLGLEKHLSVKLKTFLDDLRQDTGKIAGKLLVSMFYISGLFLAQKTTGFPWWLTYQGIEIVSFFIILYLPIVLLFNLSFKISLFFTVLFLILSPIYFVGNNEAGADYVSTVAFLFLFITFFQKLAEQ